MAQVLAYSGIGNPNIILSESNTITDSSGTDSLNITIPSNGRIQFCLASSSASSVAAGGTITIQVLRNGTIIASTDVDKAEFAASVVAGYMFYDTLGFLSGAIVQAGEVFTLNFTHNGGAANVTHTEVLVIGILPEIKTFVA